MHSDPSYTINSLKAKSLFPIRTIELLHKTNSKCFLFHSMICAYSTNLWFTEESEKTEKKKMKCRLVCLSLSFYIINFNINWLMKESNMRQCHIFFPLNTVHGVLRARTLRWFVITFSSGPHFVRTLHHDPSVLGSPTWHGS